MTIDQLRLFQKKLGRSDANIIQADHVCSLSKGILDNVYFGGNMIVSREHVMLWLRKLSNQNVTSFWEEEVGG